MCGVLEDSHVFHQEDSWGRILAEVRFLQEVLDFNEAPQANLLDGKCPELTNIRMMLTSLERIVLESTKEAILPQKCGNNMQDIDYEDRDELSLEEMYDLLYVLTERIKAKIAIRVSACRGFLLSRGFRRPPGKSPLVDMQQKSPREKDTTDQRMYCLKAGRANVKDERPLRKQQDLIALRDKNSRIRAVSVHRENENLFPACAQF